MSTDDTTPRDQHELTRRDVLVGTGLAALIYGSATIPTASAQTGEDGRAGYACRWRGDRNADGYGVYDLGIAEFDDLDDSNGDQAAAIVNRNGTLYVRRYDEA